MRNLQASLQATFQATWQWRLMLLWTLCMLVPTAIAALPAWQLLAAGLDYSALDLAQRLDVTVLSDLMTLSRPRLPMLGAAGAAAVLATLLLAPLLAGMAGGAARRSLIPGSRPARFAALFTDGRQNYWRMLRMLAWTLFLLALAGGLCALAVDWARMRAASALTASEAALGFQLAGGLWALLFVLIQVSGDAGRALLAHAPQRRSALAAWRDGCRLLWRHPLAMLGWYGLISALGLALAAAIGLARLRVAGVGVPAFLGALLLSQAMVAVVGWMRCGRIIVLVHAIDRRTPRAVEG